MYCDVLYCGILRWYMQVLSMMNEMNEMSEMTKKNHTKLIFSVYSVIFEQLAWVAGSCMGCWWVLPWHQTSRRNQGLISLLLRALVRTQQCTYIAETQSCNSGQQSPCGYGVHQYMWCHHEGFRRCDEQHKLLTRYFKFLLPLYFTKKWDKTVEWFR